jgi:hypothetical protein
MYMKHLPKTFELSDLGAAAALLSCGFKLQGLHPTEGRRVVFVFQNDPVMGLLVDRFWSGHLSVDALEYFNSVKFLKTRLHAL